jgi:DNA modification methylase
MSSLTDREKEQLKAMIDGGQPLPARYKALLFGQPHETELIWPGKTHEVTNVVLPFQSIEQIDEPRAITEGGTTDLFAFDQGTGRQTGGWTNKLIWGDNKLVLASLKNGPLRREIEAAGGLKLVYIDPPFDVGADFSFDVEIGNDIYVKNPSVIEEIAYRDTWGRGQDSYISMLFERLILIHSLLASDGSLFVHCDWRVTASVRSVLDEIFGAANLRNEIVWCFTGPGSPGMRQFNRKHNTIWWYSKGSSWNFNDQDIRVAHDDKTVQNFKGGLVGSGFIADTYKLDQQGKIPESWWEFAIAQRYPVDGIRRTGYATEKPFPLLERVVRAASKPGDLVADFFCGSGTTLAVAEKLGRKWIGCDLGRFAIHTSRKRLIGMQRELKAGGSPYRSFEILNLGKYERQFFVGIDPTLPEKQRRALSIQKEEHYLTLILTAYKAERAFQSSPFHGRKGGALVLVGPIDAPVTQAQVQEAVSAARKLRISKLDVLGFEFEMGLVPHAQDEARAKGVALALRYIPKDVFDRRAIEKGQITFYDVAFVEVQPAVKERSVTVKLKDFGIYYRQEDIDALTATMKNGASRVTVDSGQVVKIVKEKNGVVKREVLTKAWSDWIDYWAVDFDFENRKEIIRLTEADGSEREAWTGGYIFENEWQSYRTRKDRVLELSSVTHEYQKPGRYKIAVKVIDIFGNDTTKVVEIAVTGDAKKLPEIPAIRKKIRVAEVAE